MDPQQLITLLSSLTWTGQAQSINAADVDVRQPFWQWSVVARALAPAVLAGEQRIVSITGSQGSGKSTFARILVQQLNELGVQAACVSLDDFYLSKQSRTQLGRDIHPLLATRGVPGTHDCRRLGDVLAQFASSKGVLSLSLPQFDKGLDDRVRDTHVAAEVLVFEGWCLGVQPQPQSLLQEPVNELERLEDPQGTWRQWCNQQICQHYQGLWDFVDAWMLLQPPEFAQVIEWRRQQEMDLAPTQRMSETALQRFIQHYERLTRWQWESEKLLPGLEIHLDENHRVSDVR